MIRGRLVSIKYRYGTPIIDMWIRTEDDKKVKVTITDFRPYFYVPDSDGYYVGIDGERLKRIECEHPKQVEKVRERFEKHYEANIPYVQRFLIDTDIYDGVEVPHDGIVSWKQVRPCNVSVPLHVVFFDIEVGNPGERITEEYIQNAPHPVICYTMYYNGKWFTGVYREDLESKFEKREDNWFILYHNDERDLLISLLKLFKIIEPDVFVVWNARFDLPYLISRYKKLGVHFDYEGFECFDAMIGYMQVKQRDEYISLKEAGIDEGIISQEEKEDFNYDWWYNDLHRLIHYNRRDVYIMLEINNKYRLFERYEARKVLAGLASFEMVYDQKPAIDVAHLREAKMKGIILPTYAPPKTSKFEGAYVHQPQPGLYEGVAVFDFSRYYPSIILSFKLDPVILYAYYKHHKEFHLPTYLKFAEEWVKNGGKTLTLDVVKKFLKLRDQIDSEIEKAQPGTPEYERLQDLKLGVKALINAIYGVMGHDGFRLFAIELASSVTALAREGIQAIMRRVREIGYVFIYGDTDSVMVQCSKDEAPQLAKELTEFVNNYFYEKYGVRTDVKLKYEKYFATVFFTDAKKKYAYRCIWEGKECDYIGFKGFEVVRSDYSKFTKQLMREVLELVLRKKFKELEKLIPKKVREFKKVPLSEIAIPKGIDKPSFEAYNKLPHHVRGAIYSNTFFGENITPGMKVYYIYVKDVKGKPYTNVVSFSDPEKFDKYADLLVVDWRRMIKFSIEDRVKKIFNYLGIPLRLDSNQTTLW